MIKKSSLQQIGLLFIFFSFSVSANLKIEKELQKLPPGTQLSFLAQPLGNKEQTLINYNAERFASPASVQKLVTALAAMLELGSDFTFKTTLYITGKIKNKILDGDVILKMSGDPTLTETRLNALFKALSQKGVQTIKGNIIIDTSIFSGHDKASGWSWNNLTSCYNAPPSASIINGNCFWVDVISGEKVGDLATFKIKPIYPISMDIDVKTIDKTFKNDDEDRYCEFNIDYKMQNKYLLTGCLRQNKNPVTLKFAVQDGVEYLTQFINQSLQKNKIKLTGAIKESKKSPLDSSSIFIASTLSPKLSVLLNKMLKQSDNMIADVLFRTIGAHYYKTSGTWQNSSLAIKAILKNKAKINLANAVIEDGSGLSRLNLIDSAKIMAILQYIGQNDKTLNIISMLPISGKDGTLLYRSGLQDPDLKMAVSAKTGHLTGIYNMAGFLKQPNGKYIAFVQFISGYNAKGIKTQSKKTPLAEFEHSLYKQLLTYDD